VLNIFTDGSCEPNPGPGGWAFVVYDNGAEIHTACGGCESTTNNRMEMEAVLRALEWAAGRGAAMIHSDSQYVVKGITQWTAGWKSRGWKRKEKNGSLADVKNVDLWQAIDAARRPGHGFVWVRGHNGVLGNERADSLAEAARVSATPLPA
jgi:ribonuclease HI